MLVKFSNTARAIIPLCAATILIATVHVAPSAQAASRESTRVMLLDQCVNDEYRRQRNSDGIVKRCQCASKKAIADLSDIQINGATFGKPLSRGLRRTIKAAIQQCE